MVAGNLQVILLYCVCLHGKLAESLHVITATSVVDAAVHICGDEGQSACPHDSVRHAAVADPNCSWRKCAGCNYSGAPASIASHRKKDHPERHVLAQATRSPAAVGTHRAPSGLCALARKGSDRQNRPSTGCLRTCSGVEPGKRQIRHARIACRYVAGRAIPRSPEDLDREGGEVSLFDGDKSVSGILTAGAVVTAAAVKAAPYRKKGLVSLKSKLFCRAGDC